MVLTKDKSFYKSLVLLAIPIALQYLITAGVNLADNLMVGSLEQADAAVSGVYLGSQIQTILQVVIGGIEGALLVLAAQYWGRRDMRSIRRISVLCLWGAALIGVVVFVVTFFWPAQVARLFTADEDTLREGAVYIRTIAFSYLTFCLTQVLVAALRSVETARVGLYVSLLSVVVNIGLNYVLIFGRLGFPAMGVRGAGMATLISRVLELAVTLVYVALFDKKLRLRLRDLSCLDGELLRDLVHYGLPILGGQAVWAVNLFACSAILGAFNKEVLAASSVAGVLFNLLYVAMTGLSSAVGIITGKTVGAGLYEKMKEYARTVQIIFLAAGVLTGLLLLLTRTTFIALYPRLSDAARDYAMQFTLVLSVSVVGTSYQATGLAGLVKSGGDTAFVFKNDAIFVFLVVIPASLAALKLGCAPWVVFALLKCDQILKCAVAVVKINRFNWMKNLTR